jgi:hypothetical protein
MVYVSLRDISPGGIILCTAAYCDCVALLIATEGTEFIVTGKIKNVEKYGGNLYDCKFEIPQKAA